MPGTDGQLILNLPYEVVKKAAYFLKTCKQQATQSRMFKLTHNRLYERFVSRNVNNIRNETETLIPRKLVVVVSSKMISKEWDELLRQQDEETTFADKYAEELEMMDEMETGKLTNKYCQLLNFVLQNLPRRCCLRVSHLIS